MGNNNTYYGRQNYGPPNMSTGFPGGSVVKNPPANTGDWDLIPGLGRSPGEGNGNPLQYSRLGKNPMDRGAWQATVPWCHRRVRHDLGTNQQQQQNMSTF